MADTARLRAEDAPPAASAKPRTLGVLLDHAWPLTLLLFAFGAGALIVELHRSAAVDLNTVILILFLAGVLLHWRPSSYVAAIRQAGRFTGPLILQYPLYGGLMGIMRRPASQACLPHRFSGFRLRAHCRSLRT